MRPTKDGYGQEIWAYFKAKESFEIIERDDGYFSISGGAKTYFSEYKDWPEHEKRSMRLVKGKVLDIGCGAGRHSLYLQKKGFDVIGIDNSPLAVKVCKLRGLKKIKVMSITDVGKFKLNSFDTIIMMGNNFGLFGSFKRTRLLLKKFYKITSPNALIIAESNDPYKTENPAHLEYHKLNRKRGRMAGQLRIRVRFEKYVGEWFDYLLVSKREMKEILDGTDWRVKKFIDSKKSSYIAIIEKR
ncbi:MAG: class I SAM-dependent methyltransferase [Methanosarcinales archaeon]